MSISPLSASPAALPTPEIDPVSSSDSQTAGVEKASHQFESILLRQFLTDSMKPLLEGGPTGQVYGYLLTDALANSISDAGGLGLSSVLQSQLGKQTR